MIKLKIKLLHFGILPSVRTGKYKNGCHVGIRPSGVKIHAHWATLAIGNIGFMPLL